MSDNDLIQPLANTNFGSIVSGRGPILFMPPPSIDLFHSHRLLISAVHLLSVPLTTNVAGRHTRVVLHTSIRRAKASLDQVTPTRLVLQRPKNVNQERHGLSTRRELDKASAIIVVVLILAVIPCLVIALYAQVPFNQAANALLLLCHGQFG